MTEESRFAVALMAAVGLITSSVALSKPVEEYVYKGEMYKGESWTLRVKRGSASYTVRLGRYRESWWSEPIDFRQAASGEPVGATFNRTYVVAAEAIDEDMPVVMTFTQDVCRDRRGRIYPITVKLQLGKSEVVKQGCGKHFPWGERNDVP